MDEKTMSQRLDIACIFVKKIDILRDPLWLKYIPNENIKTKIRHKRITFMIKHLKTDEESEMLFQKADDLLPDIVLVCTGDNYEFQKAVLLYELQVRGASPEEIRELEKANDEENRKYYGIDEDS